MEIQNYRPVDKGFMLGSFDLVFPKWAGIQIRECKLFEKDGERWISMPSRQFEGDGGKKAYAPLVKFDEESFTRLQAKTLELLIPFLDTSVRDFPEAEELEMPF